MAKIVPSPSAPSQPFRLVLGVTAFDLDGSKKTSSYETDDPTVIANARAHPWADVVTEKADVVVGGYKPTLDPALDPLSAQHERARIAVSPEAARAALRPELVIQPVAIDAALDQDKVVTSGPVAETVEAADKAEAKADAKTSKEKK